MITPRSLRAWAFVTAGLAYALIVLGAFVRITGSGMGCGDDWPLCNGRLIPPLNDPATLIEWSHRLVAAAVSVLVLIVAAGAWLRRRETGGSGRGGTVRPAALSLVLLIVQVLLGAITVWLELPPGVVVLHLSVALALLAALVITGLRAGTVGISPTPGPGRSRWPIFGAAALAAAVILLGGLTANLGAGPACLGFPLCSGQFWPAASESGLGHVHWTHRLLAYALVAHLAALALQLSARRAPVRLRAACWVMLGIAALQIAVAAVMVLALLPPVWRGLHAAVGTALWVGLVYLVWLSSRRSVGEPRAAPSGAALASAGPGA